MVGSLLALTLSGCAGQQPEFQADAARRARGSSSSPSSTATTPPRTSAARSRRRSSPSRARASRSPRGCSSRTTSLVQWGHPLVPENEAADAVLAYLKTVPEQGGLVLLQDGWTVKTMTVNEFKAAPKAAGR